MRAGPVEGRAPGRAGRPRRDGAARGGGLAARRVARRTGRPARPRRDRRGVRAGRGGVGAGRDPGRERRRLDVGAAGADHRRGLAADARPQPHRAVPLPASRAAVDDRGGLRPGRGDRVGRRQDRRARIAAYTASKHGVLGLVRTAAAEVAAHRGHRQRRLPGVRRHPDDRRSRSRTSPPAPVAPRTRPARILAHMQPIGRLVTVDEVAVGRPAVRRQRARINGQGINVDGGAVQS